MTANGRRSGGRGGRAAARLPLFCALLAGLFLMHGSPTSAGGCHQPEPTAAAAVAVAPDGTPGSPGHHAAPATEPVADPAAAPATARALAAPGTAPEAGHPAVSCVSTRDRDGAGLPAPGPAALAVTAVLPAALAGPHRRSADGPRAPPAAGRRLLLRMCVART
ncbi:hypothetical protein ACFVHB_17955 [Kitasatospora sp. NPDC127111]|uniref:hypothetical protein n=1 Tax=Kitasatospora sp. NPDC127111 TaxID=3345363 RepID=UPI003627030F